MIAALGLVAVLLAALVVAAGKGPREALAWIFFPALILIPIEVVAGVPGFPDLNARRAAVIGLLIGSVLGGRGAQLAPVWRPFDLLPVLVVLAHSLSFASHTEPLGFAHSMAVLTLDWLLPYVFVRALWRSYRDVRQALQPFAIATVLLAVLSLYEARMATRVTRVFWNALTGLPVPGHFEMWRWGFLRAFGTFTHPITLGVFFASVTPLMILWGQIDPRYRMHSRVAALATAFGCITSLSRGPMLALVAACGLGLFLSKQRRMIYVCLVPAALLLVPYLLGELNQAISFTRTELDTRGNTDSGYYRLALLMIYLDDIGQAGWFGNRSIVGQEFEAAWSIDNGYLYLFLESGWLGGGVFLVMILTTLGLSGFALQRARGAIRRVRAVGLASLLGLLFGMADVWFAPDYAVLVFVGCALVVNQTRGAWFAARRRIGPQPVGPPPRAPVGEWIGTGAAVSQRG